MNDPHKFHCIELLVPTVVPAIPGYRGAAFYVQGDEVPAATTVDDLSVVYDPIIAWIIRPVVAGRGTSEERMDEPEVTPVYITGPAEERMFIVDPAGQWTTFSTTYENEPAARAGWLALHRSKSGNAR